MEGKKTSDPHIFDGVIKDRKSRGRGGAADQDLGTTGRGGDRRFPPEGFGPENAGERLKGEEGRKETTTVG